MWEYTTPSHGLPIGAFFRGESARNAYRKNDDYSITKRNSTVVLSRRCDDGQHEHDERHPLQDNAQPHQSVAVFRIELAAAYHGEQTDEKRAEHGEHRHNQEAGENSAHSLDIGCRRTDASLSAGSNAKFGPTGRR